MYEKLINIMLAIPIVLIEFLHPKRGLELTQAEMYYDQHCKESFLGL